MALRPNPYHRRACPGPQAEEKIVTPVVKRVKYLYNQSTNMTDTANVTCPQCGHEFPASEGLEKKLRLQIEAEKLLEVKDLQKVIQENEEKIKSFREQELALREKSRKLEDKEKDLELETQRRMEIEKKKVEEDTAKRLAEEYRFKDLEKEKQISDMKKLIEDLKRTSQQNSMQTQGEVGELDLQDMLTKLFPTDEITEVKKGELGGDVRQVVRTQRGTDCGMILWERKRTKAWDEKWIAKLKEDMQRDKAHLGVIVSEVLPKDFKKEIGERNGVWLVTTNFVEPIATLLRKNLYDIAKGRAIALNKQSKAEELYDFVTGRDFIVQVERMVEIYLEMRMQITKERVASEKLWKQREMQVDGLLKGVSGIYGGMQHIAGTALPQVKSLELPEGDA